MNLGGHITLRPLTPTHTETIIITEKIKAFAHTPHTPKSPPEFTAVPIRHFGKSEY